MNHKYHNTFKEVYETAADRPSGHEWEYRGYTFIKTGATLTRYNPEVDLVNSKGNTVETYSVAEYDSWKAFSDAVFEIVEYGPDDLQDWRYREGSKQEFAFGSNEVDGCECPAVAAGYRPGIVNNDVTEVASMYDKQVHDILQKEKNSYKRIGTVQPCFAKEAWDDVIGKFETGTVWWHLAIDIAEQLGWR